MDTLNPPARGWIATRAALPLDNSRLYDSAPGRTPDGGGTDRGQEEESGQGKPRRRRPANRREGRRVPPRAHGSRPRKTAGKAPTKKAPRAATRKPSATSGKKAPRPAAPRRGRACRRTARSRWRPESAGLRREPRTRRAGVKGTVGRRARHRCPGAGRAAGRGRRARARRRRRRNGMVTPREAESGVGFRDGVAPIAGLLLGSREEGPEESGPSHFRGSHFGGFARDGRRRSSRLT